jgi:hypothetical protein
MVTSNEQSAVWQYIPVMTGAACRMDEGNHGERTTKEERDLEPQQTVVAPWEQ